MNDANGGDKEIFHRFDASMRVWSEPSLPEVSGWLEPAVAGLPADQFAQQATTLNVSKIEADLLITVGPDRILHVEYERSPGPDLVHRMYDYGGRIRRRYPGRRLSQHIIVLGNGWVRGHDDLAANGFVLDLHVVYLRDHDPAEFLADPILAPFAALAGGTRAVREKSFAAALILLRDSGDPRWKELSEVAGTLASVRLDGSTINRIMKETAMDKQPIVDFYRDFDFGQELQQEGREQGLRQGIELGVERGIELGVERGIELGVERGIERAHQQTLHGALVRRFGEVPQVEAVARRLAEADLGLAVEAIGAASSIDALLTVDPTALASERSDQR